MKIKPLTLLLALTFLFLFSGSVFGDDLQDGFDAYKRNAYKEAFKLFRLSAVKGNASAQYNLGVMYAEGQGVTKDSKEANKWYRFSAEQGNTKAQTNLG